MILFDHTEPSWYRRYLNSNRQNGAFTYSVDIVNHQIPLWESILPEDAVVSTAAPLYQIKRRPEASVAVQYLHTFDPGLSGVRRVAKLYPKVIFVTAYQRMATRMRSMGFKAVYIPMTIDRDALPEKGDPWYEGGRLLYFGNLTKHKKHPYTVFKKRATTLGWAVDTLSHNQWSESSNILSRDEQFQIINLYTYGIGVGRCALEMGALGLKVLIYGNKLGGVILNKTDAAIQTSTNFNSALTTGGNSLRTCLRRLPDAIPATNTIQDWLPEIQRRIEKSAR